MLVALGLPIAALMLAALLVTRAVTARVPESVPGLLAAACISAVILWGLSAAGFAALYRIEGAPAALIGTAPGGLGHFLSLGAKAALIWAPMMALVIVTAPRRWRDAVW